MTVKGILAQSSGELFSNKIFYLYKGKRHWVQSKAWIDDNGFAFPEDVKFLPDDVLLAFLPGQPASRAVDLKTVVVSNVGEAREVAASPCFGSGLEIGAGSSAFPVPIDCCIQYGDMYSYEELLQNAYAGQPLHDIIAPTIKTSIDKLEGVKDQSLDFIVACHVIEHTRDPIGAIKAAYDKLKSGGHLVLVVPDMLRTFDRNRPLTKLDHMIDDYHEIHVDRDKNHYKEFFTLADGFNIEPSMIEEKYQQEWKNGYSIHFHTWTYVSFKDMITWIIKNVCPFTILWSYETLPDGIEFYMTLRK